MKALLILCLLSLISCSQLATETKYVACTVPIIPPAPQMYAVTWENIDGRYSFSNDGFIALITNVKEMRRYQDELRTILENLKK